jgi:uncharacterized protein
MNSPIRQSRLFYLLIVPFFFLINEQLPAQTEKPQSKLVQFQMAILKLGPNWQSTRQEEKDAILRQHVSALSAMLESGKAVVVGTIVDDPTLFAIVILRTSSIAEANEWAQSDPAVKAGLFNPEIHPWFSEDIFKKADFPIKYETVYLGFLKRGPNRKAGDDKTPEIQELQKAHLANIGRLAETKKLVMAGPFGDDGDLRGIFVFRVGSMKEAEDLAATDPMIKIDRLRLELHPWHVPVGEIP